MKVKVIRPSFKLIFSFGRAKNFFYNFLSKVYFIVSNNLIFFSRHVVGLMKLPTILMTTYNIDVLILIWSQNLHPLPAIKKRHLEYGKDICCNSLYSLIYDVSN